MVNIERFVERHLPNGYSEAYVVEPLQGGISSVHYKVIPNGETEKPFLVTIYPEPKNWWKLDKEIALRQLLEQDADVPIPAILDTGIDNIDQTDTPFLIREFISGLELDNLLEHADSLGVSDSNTAEVAYDLGFKLGKLHSHRFFLFGLITDVDKVSDSPRDWKDYIMRDFETQSRMIKHHDSNKYIGEIPVQTIQMLARATEKFAGIHSAALDSVKCSRITHGDARFANFIAGFTPTDRLTINAFIDMEWALAGDPEIDLTYIENWLHFSKYKDNFEAGRSKLIDGYRQTHEISTNYTEKRLLYHALRSLTYLAAVSKFDQQYYLQSNPRNASYVQGHVDILQSLIRGNALEDVNIKSLS